MGRKLKMKSPELNDYRQIIAWTLPVSFLLLVILVAARGIRDLGEVTEARGEEAKSAGEWIASHSNGTKISWSVGWVVPYYAETVARLLPCSDSTTTLRIYAKKLLISSSCEGMRFTRDRTCRRGCWMKYPMHVPDRCIGRATVLNGQF
jgi:hypothetical protein